MSHLSDDTVARLPISEGRAELLEEILTTAPATERSTIPIRPRSARGRRAAVALGAVAAVAAVAVGVPLALRGHDHPTEPATVASQSPTPDYSASQLAVWPMVKGWRVLSTEGPAKGGGQISYGSGQPWSQKIQGGAAYYQARRTIDITWYPASQWKGYAADRASEKAYGDVEVLGRTGHAITYSRTDHAVLRPVVGKWFLEVRVQGINAAGFDRILGELKGTDVAGLQASLPSRFVKDGERASRITEMAKDIPLPPGFSLSDIHSNETDPYQLGANVAGAIACAWIDDWASGHQKAAVAAMATSRDWAVLNQMNPEGDYPEVLWQTADEMKHGTKADIPGWESGLGCS